MSRRTNRYKKNLNLRKEGKYPGLPIGLVYPKMGAYVMALPREATVVTMGSTGSGKTQYHKRLGFELVKLNMLDPKMPQPIIILNLLEESKDEYEDSIVCMMYYDKYEKDLLKKLKDSKGNWIQRIDKQRLNSYDEDLLTDLELKRLEELDPAVEAMMNKYYRINDNIYHPYGLYLFARKVSEEVGTHHYSKVKFNSTDSTITYKEYPDNITRQDYAKLSDEAKKAYVYKEYKLKDENVYPLIITDHLGLMTPEKNKDTGKFRTKWETMASWSFDYVRKEISKLWKFNAIDVMQLSAASQKKSFDYKSELNWEALKPTLDAMSDNKVIAQNYYVILSLFDPERYSTNTMMDGFDLSKCDGRLRTCSVLKNRIGRANAELPMYFDGKASVFLEISGTKNKSTGDLENLKANRKGKPIMDFYKLCKT